MCLHGNIPNNHIGEIRQQEDTYSVIPQSLHRWGFERKILEHRHLLKMAWPKKGSGVELTATQKRCLELSAEMERNRRIALRRRKEEPEEEDVDDEYHPSDEEMDESSNQKSKPSSPAKSPNGKQQKPRGRDSPGIRPPIGEDLEPRLKEVRKQRKSSESAKVTTNRHERQVGSLPATICKLGFVSICFIKETKNQLTLLFLYD